MEILVEFMARGFLTMLTISMPCVLCAASVGLVVGILQAVTQVQEQTIAAAPKIISVFLTIVALGMFYINTLTGYFKEGVNLAFNVIPKNGSYVLPADYYYHTSPFAAEMKDGVSRSTGKTEKLLKNPGKIPWAEKQEKDKFGPVRQGANPRPNLIETNKILNK